MLTRGKANNAGSLNLMDGALRIAGNDRLAHRVYMPHAAGIVASRETSSGIAVSRTFSIRSAKVNSICLADRVGQLAQVILVGLGKDHPANPGPVGGQHFLLDAADWQNEPGERDLAGHGSVAANGEAGIERRQGRRHGDTGRRAILGDGAGRNVDVQPGVTK